MNKNIKIKRGILFVPRLSFILFCILSVMHGTALASTQTSPCDIATGKLNADYKSSLSSAISRQLGEAKVSILEVFQEGEWSIVYIDPHDADEAFLFFHGNPLTARYVTLWAGAAKADEKTKIREWAQSNALGIPVHLADCFASYVTDGTATAR